MKMFDFTSFDPSTILLNNQGLSVKTFPISNYISWIEITSLAHNEDVVVKLNDRENVYLHFLFNLKNVISLSSAGNGTKSDIQSYQSAILYEKKGLSIFLHIKKNHPYKIGVIQLKKFDEIGEVNGCFEEFETIFKTLSQESHLIHSGLPNLEIGEYAELLFNSSKNQLTDKLMASGYINILLSLKLKQFIDFIKNPTLESPLTQFEIKQIKQISDTILNEPQHAYNIVELSRMVGITSNKLQFGIKEMHGRTVCDFIRHIRLLKAEELIKNTDMNISEIVYSVGWTSRSYFSKIFKLKFNCAPREYQEYYIKANVDPIDSMQFTKARNRSNGLS